MKLQVKGRQDKDYNINICGGERYCNGSAVCHGTNGYGSLASVIFDYSRDDMKLKYSNGSKCNNSKLNHCISIIHIVHSHLTSINDILL